MAASAPDGPPLVMSAWKKGALLEGGREEGRNNGFVKFLRDKIRSYRFCCAPVAGNEAMSTVRPGEFPVNSVLILNWRGTDRSSATAELRLKLSGTKLR